MDFKLLFQQILALYHKLNNRQRIVILGTILAVIAFIAFLVVFNSKPAREYEGYKVLFENVNSKDAALIIQQLQQDGIEYKLADDSTILIPEEQVYEERIKLASAGLPKNSDVGFELFDQQEFGATDFDQKIKYLRAIEGELSRTIQSLTPIERAEVHIALPKETVFVSKEILPTASVVLELAINMVLTPKQVYGIKNLVGASVPQLLPENVQIVDQNGEPLGDDNGMAASRELAEAQMKYKKSFERTLEDKIINILSPFIGSEERVVAKVTVDFDFAQKESTEEVYDPNNVVRSEQLLEEKREGYRPKEIGGVPGAVSNIGPVQGLDEQSLREKYEKSETTTNYEISKITSSVRGEFATLKRITAAVVVDGKYELQTDDAGIEKLAYIALAQNDLTQISDLVKQTIGFNPARGDEVTVSNFEFGSTSALYKPKSTAERIAEMIRTFLSPFMPLVKYIFAGIILYIFYKKVIVPFAERMLEVHVEEEEDVDSLFDVEEEEEDSLNKLNDLKKKIEEQLGIGDGVGEDDLKHEVLLEKIKEVMQDKPDEIATLFQNLIKDEVGTETLSELAKGKG